MALIMCPECRKEVSDRAKVCVHCGFPIAEFLQEKPQTVEYAGVAPDETDAAIQSCTEVFDRIYFEGKHYFLRESGNEKRFQKYFPTENEPGEEGYGSLFRQPGDALLLICGEMQTHLKPLEKDLQAYTRYTDNLLTQLHKRNRWYGCANVLFENVIWDLVDFSFVEESFFNQAVDCLAQMIDDNSEDFDHMITLIGKILEYGNRRQEKQLMEKMKKFRPGFHLRSYYKSWQMLSENMNKRCKEWEEQNL